MPHQTVSRFLDVLRAWPLAAIALALVAVVLLTDLARLDLLIWGLTKVAVLAYAGYWIDRWIFPYARPHDWWWDSTPGEAEPYDPQLDERLSADELKDLESMPVITPIPQIRRAIIMAACILVAVLIP